VYLNTIHCVEIALGIEEEEEAEEDFGREKRSISPCHNFQQPGHYARECPLPPGTCMYCHTLDHDMEEFPTLLGNI
jgi:hypothetical protein